MWSTKKKTIRLVVTLSVPANMPSAKARKELREIVNDPAQYHDIRIRKIEGDGWVMN